MKQGILLGFRFGDLVDLSGDHGRWPFYDKDTMTLKKPGVAAGVRIVPGGSTIRDGAFVASSVVCMPPMYVNIGAYINEGSLVDSHALVGSCAQIGKRVHLSAGAQIGGVIEPVGALPVIIEDDVLVGGNTGVYEGAVIKQRAVLAAGVILTGVHAAVRSHAGRDHPRRREPAVGRPGRRRRRARRARGDGRARKRLGSVARDARHRQVPRRPDGYADGARDVDPLTQIRLTRDLIDIDSTTPNEVAGRPVPRRHARGVSAGPSSSSRSSTAGSTSSRTSAIRSLSSPPISIVSRRSSRAAKQDGRLYGRGACDAKGILVAQIAAAERLRASGESRVGLLFVVGEERGSEGATAANGSPLGSRFLINGEPTDNRLATATRGVYRVRLRAKGTAAHSSLPHLGVSAIDKLVDALVALRRVEWPADPDMGKTFYTIGLINGGVAPNVISPDADAELMFRTVGDHAELRQQIERAAGGLVSVEDVLVVPPVRLTTRPGFDTESFAFTTDIPFLDRWGAPLLLGPGSVTVAHTADEYVEIAELHRAVDLYERLVKELLA